MPWSMCTKEDVMSIHPTKENALPDFYSIAVEDLIRQHLGNPNLGNHTVVIGELHEGLGSAFIVLDQGPVISVEVVTVDGIPVDPATLTYHPQRSLSPSSLHLVVR